MKSWSMRWRVSGSRDGAKPVLVTSFGLRVLITDSPHGFLATKCCLSPHIPQVDGKYYDCAACRGATGVSTQGLGFGAALASAMGPLTRETVETWIGWLGIDALTATLVSGEIAEALESGARVLEEDRPDSLSLLKLLPPIDGERSLA